jgi:predicted nucleic acid-binding protein
MTVLIDAGAIVALYDRRQPEHQRCYDAFHQTDDVLVTCEPVITEACFLLRRLGDAVRDLLAEIEAGKFVVQYSLAFRAGQVARLMRKYADVPMDLADACLVDMADEIQTGRIFTLDADFRVYRWARNRPFELLLEDEA